MSLLETNEIYKTKQLMKKLILKCILYALFLHRTINLKKKKIKKQPQNVLCKFTICSLNTELFEILNVCRMPHKIVYIIKLTITYI